jgi:SAM-dependent methyltransferase
VGLYCPGCGCPDRARFLWLYLEREWPGLFSEPLRLLQFAPIPSLDRRLREQPNLRYLSGDLHEPEAMVRLDLTALDLPDESFDAVICMHVFAHISNDRKAMREMFRILRPGGVAFVMTPIDEALETTFEDPCVVSPAEKTRVYGDFDYVRTYGRDFIDRLRQAGFDVSIVQAAEKFDEAAFRTHGLWDDRIFVSHRPHRSGAGGVGAEAHGSPSYSDTMETPRS